MFKYSCQIWLWKLYPSLPFLEVWIELTEGKTVKFRYGVN